MAIATSAQIRRPAPLAALTQEHVRPTIVVVPEHRESPLTTRRFIPSYGYEAASPTPSSPAPDISVLRLNITKIISILLPNEGPDRVFLGGSGIRQSSSLLEKGITHIVQLCSDEDISAMEEEINEEEFEITVIKQDIKDSIWMTTADVKEKLDHVIDETVAILATATNRVFIHCQMGISRSPAFTMALIGRLNPEFTEEDAKQVLKDSEYISDPNSAIVGAYFEQTGPAF